jgi:hypothetical protein
MGLFENLSLFDVVYGDGDEDKEEGKEEDEKMVKK